MHTCVVHAGVCMCRCEAKIQGLCVSRVSVSVPKFVCLDMRALGIDVKQGFVCAHVRSFNASA